MKVIPYSELVIPADRIRRNFDDEALMELAGSIFDKGLMHPPCLRNDNVTLLAGERRVRAMMHLHGQGRPFRCDGREITQWYIPYIVVSDLSPEALLEAELEENVLREELTWQERSIAVSGLHNLRQKQHGAFDRSTGEGWTARDTATEILGSLAQGQQITQVIEAGLLAKNLHIPEVAKAKSAKEAMKILQKKATAEHNAELAKSFILNDSGHTVINGDMRVELPKLPGASIDVLCTDPPYGIGADGFGSQSATGHAYEDSFEYFYELLQTLAKESFRICKAKAHAYVFCDIRNFSHLRRAFAAVGWKTWETPLIWDKNNMGMLPRPEHGPRRCYEAILYAIKGDRNITAVYSDVITCSNVSQPAFGAEKPQALYTNLLRRSVRPGDSVLDPFAGAGNIILSGEELNCSVTAIELNPEKYNYILANKLAGKGTETSFNINSIFGEPS